MFTLFRIILRTTIRAVCGINDQSVCTLQGSFALIRRFECSMWHHLETYECLVQDRRQLLQVFVRC